MKDKLGDVLRANGAEPPIVKAMSKRLLVDELNGTRTDIVREVRAADSILHNLLTGLDADGPRISTENALSLLREARRHLAKVTD